MSNRLLSKIYFALLCLLLVADVCSAQNIVSNPSFEQYIACPNGLAQVTRCIGWHEYNSADYFDVCSTNSPVGVPSNQLGNQWPGGGFAYMGLSTYTPNPNQKEYIATTFSALQIGVTYETSMLVSLADTSGYGTDDLGMYFYINNLYIPPNGAVLQVTPQVFFTLNNPITDKINWVKLRGRFIADSAYTNLIIGGFKSYFTMKKALIQANLGTRTYYYIDSVVVTADTIGVNYNDTLLCAGDTIIVPYSVISSVFSSGNIFKLQLSDAFGNFSSPLNIGNITSTNSGTIQAVIPSSLAQGNGYKLRIVSTNPAITSPTNWDNISIGKIPPGIPIATSNTPICDGDTLKLTATDTTYNVNFIWTGPNNFVSFNQNSSIANAPSSASGNYIVGAYLNGCGRKDTVNALVKPVPSKPFDAGGTTVPCTNDTLKLTASNSLSGTTFNWTGPNSFSSTIQNPKIVYPTLAASGKYFATASINGCTVKDSININVIQAPQKPTATNNTPICEGDSTTLVSSTSTTGVSYNWTGPNSFSSNIQNPKILNTVAAANGNYICTVSINGCSSKDTTSVVVNTYAANLMIGSNTPVCAGDSIKFNASSTTSNLMHSWTGPSGFNSSLQNPYRTSAVNNYTGVYTDTVNHSGCKTVATTTVVVYPLPIVPSAANNGPLCTGATLNLSTTATSSASYSWIGPNSFISTTQNPIRLFMTTNEIGYYVVYANLNGCIVKDSTYVNVYPVTPKPTISANNPVCLSAVLNLNVSTVPGASYIWTGPNNFSSPLQNTKRANIIAADGGTYSAKAMLNGCYSLPDTVTITTIQGPSVSVYASPDDTICSGANGALVSIPFGIGPLGATYQWYKNGSAAGVTTSNYIVPNANNGDKFYVEMQAIASVCNSPVQSNTVTLTVLPNTPPPSATITANPSTDIWPYLNVTFSISSIINGGSNPIYQWKLNGQNVNGATTNKWSTTTLKDGDSVCLLVTSSDECATPKNALSNCLRMNVPTGVSPLNPPKGDLQLYPNPNRGEFYLAFTSPYTSFEGGSFIVTDVTGRVIAVYNITEATTLIQLPQSLSAGVYVGKFTDGNGKVSVERIVVE